MIFKCKTYAGKIFPLVTWKRPKVASEYTSLLGIVLAHNLVFEVHIQELVTFHLMLSVF